MSKFTWFLLAFFLVIVILLVVVLVFFGNDTRYLITAIAPVGILSLALSYHQHKSLETVRKISESRDYALNAYDRHVVAPVEKALDTLDKTVDQLVKITHLKTNSKNQRDELFDYFTNLGPSVDKARRLCAEADKYLAEQKYRGLFKELLFRPKQSGFGIDDLLYQPIDLSDGTYAIEGAEVEKLIDDISFLKARVRSALTDKGREIAKTIHEKHE